MFIPYMYYFHYLYIHYSVLSIYLKTSDNTTKDLTIRLGAGLFDYNVNVTSEWQRFTLTGNTNVDRLQILLYGDENSQTADVLVYGASLEENSYATSYIKTIGTTQTRVADTCSQTVPSGIVGQSEGTVFLDFKPQTLDATSRYLSIENSSSSSNGWMGIFAALSSGDIRFRFYGDGWDFNSTLIVEKDTRYKIAFSYKNGVQTSVYVNGNLIGNITASLSGKSFQKSRLSEAAFGSRGDAEFKSLQVYTTALSDAELEKLTSYTSFTAMANAQSYTII